MNNSMNIIWNDNHTISIDSPFTQKHITGTRFASILNLNPYSTPFAMWCDITHVYEFPYEETPFTRAGNIIEPKQAQYLKDNYYPTLVTPTDLFGEDYFNTTRGNFFQDEIFGGMWDYIDKDAHGNITKLFEMKTTQITNYKSWWVDIPEYYALQASLYAWLLNVEYIEMVVTFLNYPDYSTPESFNVTLSNTFRKPFLLHERYPRFESEYIEEAKNWWHKYIETGISPVYDTEKDLELLKNIYAKY